MSKSNRVMKPAQRSVVALRSDVADRMEKLKGQLSYPVFIQCLIEAWDETPTDQRIAIMARVVHGSPELEPSAA